MGFELPATVPEEDVVVLQNLLTALESLGTDSATERPLCEQYKVEVLTTGGYLLCAVLPTSGHFEVNLDDLLFLHSVSPARIEGIAIGRSASGSAAELFIRVLDARQHVMITSTTCFWSHTTRKRIRRAQPAKRSAATSNPA